MKLVISILIVAILALVCDAKTVDSSWLSAALEARSVWRSCDGARREGGSTRWQCLKSRSLNILNNVTSSDVIPLTGSVKLVRNTDAARSNADERMLVGKSWAEKVLRKIASTLNSHHVEINFASRGNDNEGRRRRHHMLPMIAIGFTALGMILMPMGFQFLAVLGGKALLMAKMALLLASINGLKRLASSGLSYGLYQNVPQGPTGAGGLYFDRNDPAAQYSHPRAFSAQIPSQQ
ncbi:hypothetical protein DMENIID0001_133210 [Sergentomyia squamirostris]